MKNCSIFSCALIVILKFLPMPIYALSSEEAVWQESIYKDELPLFQSLFTSNYMNFVSMLYDARSREKARLEKMGISDVGQLNKLLAREELKLLVNLPVVRVKLIDVSPECPQRVLANCAIWCLNKISSVEDCEMLYDCARILRNIRKLEVPGYVSLSIRFSCPSIRLRKEQILLMEEHESEARFQQTLRTIESGFFGLFFWRCQDILNSLPIEKKKKILENISNEAGLTHWEQERFMALKESPKEDPARRIRRPTIAELNTFRKKIIGESAPEIVPSESQ